MRHEVSIGEVERIAIITWKVGTGNNGGHRRFYWSPPMSGYTIAFIKIRSLA